MANCTRVKFKNNTGAQVGLWVMWQATVIVNDGETSGNVSGDLWSITRMIGIYPTASIQFGHDCTWQIDYDASRDVLILYRLDALEEEAILANRAPDDEHQEIRSLLKEHFGENPEKGQPLRYSAKSVKELEEKLGVAR